MILVEQGLDKFIIQKMRLKTNGDSISKWLSILEILKNPDKVTEIALVGKYICHQSAYESIYESLIHGGIGNNARVGVRRVESEDIEKDGARAHLEGVKGILVPGGFGARGVEGKIAAIRYARENKIPFLGYALECSVHPSNLRGMFVILKVHTVRNLMLIPPSGNKPVGGTTQCILQGRNNEVRIAAMYHSDGHKGV